MSTTAQDSGAALAWIEARRDWWLAGQPIHVARAPGRLDVMGGIADYSGSLVLQWPLAESTHAAVQAGDDDTLRIVSAAQQDRVFTAPMSILGGGEPASYDALRQRLATKDDHWAAYVAGVALVLRRECGATLPRGLRVLVLSDVPEGKGVSSSAALEVATMRAMASLLGVELDALRLALLCQIAENRVVGAPCGIMDQATSSCGQAGKLLALLCQPAKVLGHVELPRELAVFGIDSGIRHAVSGADYGTVRTAAFMGYRMLAQKAGLLARFRGEGKVVIDDPHWQGYVANVLPSQVDGESLPATMVGRDFLEQFQGITDSVTHVDPARQYPVRAATLHPIHEHYRIRCFARLLAGELCEESRVLLGEMMVQSHRSYSSCGLGSSGTDRLVEMAMSVGPAGGVYGAKITGGGSGGTVAVLARADAGDTVRRIAGEYAQQSGRGGYVFAGSSEGAGVVRR
jgi:L-arabinokinase